MQKGGQVEYCCQRSEEHLCPLDISHATTRH